MAYGDDDLDMPEIDNVEAQPRVDIAPLIAIPTQ